MSQTNSGRPGSRHDERMEDAARHEPPEGIQPMVPFLSGYLLGCCTPGNAGMTMRITDVIPEPPNRFVVRFASGLTLRVTVQVAGENLLDTAPRGG